MSLIKAVFHTDNEKDPEVALESTGFLGFTGMRHRLSLPDDEGVLFEFAYQDDHAFWMEDVRIPLDIIFIDIANVVVHIHRDAVPFDRTPISSGKLIDRVIEVNAGWCARNNVVVGTAVSYKGL